MRSLRQRQDVHQIRGADDFFVSVLQFIYCANDVSGTVKGNVVPGAHILFVVHLRNFVNAKGQRRLVYILSRFFLT